MDLDAFITANEPQWRELEELLKRRRLTAAEADRMLDLYARIGSQLAELRAASPDPALVAWLSALLARARHRTAPAQPLGPATIGRFLGQDFPAALWRMRRWLCWSWGLNVLAVVLLTWWFLANPRIENALMSPEQLQSLIEVDFEKYYSENAAGSFALRVWTNNAWVAAQCIVVGVLGFPVIMILFRNLMNLAVIASVMIRHDRADLFFGLILPHGLLELTVVFCAAAVGLRLFWAWVAPGDLTRGASLAHWGRTAMTVVLGLAVVLALSGLIEAFVTPSGLPAWARIGIGVLALALFVAYVAGPGRRAANRGVTGDLREFDRGTEELTRG
ncbi:stage II sporulation protein M [Enemella evansiae]|uniref:Stage II sporulation protein M n=1 Tax=Enemella evansiae TaxID=2016499 RepID=A0A255G734_9ACTN|nr:stage II sporulation protein M [Enemella evansiae]PFG66082.1 putative membrane protein SpoIIM required for sporulation [Propionibacteriaceae bacterium ES.041]OYO00223.1 hypothetical protein CGZ97_19550 [Enemella evansiae]OYO04704.1 hypothetical protein CGZ96_00745 [Enemella evansiae]OYO09060.1 hypothetical protein CGZ98_14905 [Enemella evansiae]OYO11728.1 hypothetical protein CGZ94_15060 [Enemella evansiae]